MTCDIATSAGFSFCASFSFAEAFSFCVSFYFVEAFCASLSFIEFFCASFSLSFLAIVFVVFFPVSPSATLLVHVDFPYGMFNHLTIY